MLMAVVIKLQNAEAQANHPMRLEFPVLTGQIPFTVIPIGPKGLLLIYKTIDEKTGAKQKWIFSQYDVNFKKGWTQEYVPESECVFKKDELQNGLLNLLFTPIDRKGNNPIYALISIDISKGSMKTQKGVLPEKSTFSCMEFFGSSFLMAFTNGDKKAQLVIVDMKTGNSNTIIPEESGKSIAKEILLDSLKKTFSFVYELFPSKKESVFCILNLDFKLNSLSKNMIDFSAEGKRLVSLKLHSRDTINTVLIGSYTSDIDADFDKSRSNSVETTGMFTGLLKKNVIADINFYNFMDFKSFYKRFRANEVIVPKTGDNKTTSSNYLLTLHEPFQVMNNSVLLAEAYYPEYHTVTNWTYDYYGHMIPMTTSVFDGYRYNTAFIAGIDSLGKMQWNNSMEFTNILTLDLAKRISVIRDGQNLILSYNVDGKIVSKVISGNESLTSLEYTPVELLYNADKLLSDEESKIAYWYDNYMICYGLQEIKNSSKAESRRTVFYLNKIAFR